MDNDPKSLPHWQIVGLSAAALCGYLLMSYMLGWPLA